MNYYDDEDLINKTHPEFEVKCKKCGSKKVWIDNDLGYSETSGAWGSVDFVCECGNSTEICRGD